jgi:hypothetical protein
MKKLIITIVIAILAITGVVQAQSGGTIYTLDQWRATSTPANTIIPTITNRNVRIPSLGSSGSPCISVNSIGTLSTTTCGSGSGTPGGASSSVQFNGSGSFAGNNQFTYNGSTALHLGYPRNTDNQNFMIENHTASDGGGAFGSWHLGFNNDINSAIYNDQIVAGNDNDISAFVGGIFGTGNNVDGEDIYSIGQINTLQGIHVFGVGKGNVMYNYGTENYIFGGNNTSSGVDNGYQFTVGRGNANNAYGGFIVGTDITNTSGNFEFGMGEAGKAVLDGSGELTLKDSVVAKDAILGGSVYGGPGVVTLKEPTNGYQSSISILTDDASMQFDAQDNNFIFTNGIISGDTVKAYGSGGLTIKSNSNANVALLGAGGGQGATFYDGLINQGTHTSYGTITGPNFVATTTATSTFINASTTNLLVTNSLNVQGTTTANAFVKTGGLSTECLRADGSVGTCGSGSGTPGGASSTIQFNANGSFDGSNNFTYNGSTVVLNGTASTTNLTVGWGTNSAPGIYFSGQSNTGIYNDSTVGGFSPTITANGTRVMRFNSAFSTIHVPLHSGTTKSFMLETANGSVTNPNYSFNNDANTGMWSSGADTLDFTTAGVNAISINSSQKVTMSNASTTNLTVSSNLYPKSGVWADTGRVGIGTTTVDNLLHISTTTTAGTAVAKITNTGAGDFIDFVVQTATGVGHDLMNIYEGSTKKWRLGFEDNTDNFRIYNDTQGTNALTIAPSNSLATFAGGGTFGGSGSFVNTDGSTAFTLRGSSNANRMAINPQSGGGVLFYDYQGGGPNSGLALYAGRVGVGVTTPSARLQVQGAAGTASQLVIASSTGTAQFTIDYKGHKVTGGSTPTVSSCGTSPSIAGNDNNGRVTIGTSIGADTSCTITFAQSWTTAPSCVVNNESQVQLGRAVANTTTLTIDVSTTFTDSNVWNYQCEGY